MEQDSEVVDAFKLQGQLEGRRSTCQIFGVLLVFSTLYFGIYLYLFLADLDDLNRFGMTWVFIVMLVMYALDILGSILSMIGVCRKVVSDVLLDFALFIVIIAIVLNLAVFLALPSENRNGEKSSWLPQRDYPGPCFYHNFPRNEKDCDQLNKFSVDIWCTFILFFARIIIITLSRFTISYAKYGTIYTMAYYDPPPRTYVVAPRPYVQYSYYPTNPYIIQYTPQPQAQYYLVQNPHHQTQTQQQKVVVPPQGDSNDNANNIIST